MKLLVIVLLFAITALYGSNSYSVALVNMGMNYTERDDSGNFLDSEKANSILGYELRYDFDTGCNSDICSNLELRFLGLNGKSDYKGFYLVSHEPTPPTTTSNTIYDMSMDYSYIKPFSIFELLYGVGFGYHFWYRELSSIQNETYSWFYITPIVGMNVNLIHNLQLGIHLKYKYGIDPTMEANLINGSFYLGGADTLECTIPMRYTINKKVDVFIDFVVLKQSIEKSNYLIDRNYNSPVYEPSSTDYQQYIKIGATIKY